MAGRKSPEFPAKESEIYKIPSVAGKAKQKSERQRIPEAVIKRLPRYFRVLRELFNSDVLRVSSGELAELMGMTASQIRQDMSCLCAFGQQGYGYGVKQLYTRISEVCGVSCRYSAVLIGAGDIGKTLIKNMIFEQRGVKLKAVFDTDRSVGTPVYDCTVMDISKFVGFCEENAVDIAVVCAASDAVPGLLKLIKQTDIRGIWNFSLCEISPEESGLSVINTALGDSLMLLTYEMTRENENKH